MKKIIALLLVVCSCLSVLVSCGSNDVDAVGEMFRNSQPTKVVATTQQSFDGRKLESKFTLTVGYVDGKNAATYEGYEEIMRDIDSGSGVDIVGPIEQIPTKLWYHETKGVCDATQTPQKWDKNGESFVPEKGAVALNLASKYIKNYTYEGDTLTCTVPASKSEDVFGEALNSDAEVTVVNDGAFVTYVKISYVVPADSAKNLPEQTVMIEVKYTYDLETITFQ